MATKKAKKSELSLAAEHMRNAAKEAGAAVKGKAQRAGKAVVAGLGKVKRTLIKKSKQTQHTVDALV